MGAMLIVVKLDGFSNDALIKHLQVECFYTLLNKAKMLLLLCGPSWYLHVSYSLIKIELHDDVSLRISFSPPFLIKELLFSKNTL